MTVGQIVDFCITYNEMHDPEREEKQEDTVRQATQADWDNFWS